MAQHPKSEEIAISCACGNKVKVQSTACRDITVGVCSGCHNFFTGKSRVMDSAGRVKEFEQRYNLS